jgi:hypothetical protein
MGVSSSSITTQLCVATSVSSKKADQKMQVQAICQEAVLMEALALLSCLGHNPVTSNHNLHMPSL